MSTSQAGGTLAKPKVLHPDGLRDPQRGRKVVITDTDHYVPGKGDALWAWKSFFRGHNPILIAKNELK